MIFGVLVLSDFDGCQISKVFRPQPKKGSGSV